MLGHGPIRLTGLDAAPEPRNLRRLKAAPYGEVKLDMSSRLILGAPAPST